MRDKLLNLIYDSDPISHDGSGYVDYVKIANHLIANGVTLQQWIPVIESLPEPFVSVLVQMPGEKPFPTVREGYVGGDGLWYAGYYTREPGEVTHWMPLPEPPKEGE